MTQRITLITGASAGLGVDFARQLAARGDRLVLVARRKERLDALAAELGNARAVVIDLGEAGAAGRLMADLAAHGESVACLVNNAGFGLAGRVAELDGPRQRQMIDLNCGALTELAHAVLPGMIAAKTGRIINVASTAAFQPGPGMAVYFATKAFVLSFSEALHEEVRDHGITVTALCPGPTATEFGEVAGWGKAPVIESLSARSADVVRAGIAAMDHGKVVAVTGLFNKLSAQSYRVLPRALLRLVTGKIIQKSYSQVRNRTCEQNGAVQ